MQYREDETPPPPASTTASPASPPGPTELARLEEAVLGEAGTGLRAMFVNHLFARSLDTYEQVLRRLHATASWSDASKIIAEDVFRTFKVNIYSDPAILFTDTVEAGYLKREA